MSLWITDSGASTSEIKAGVRAAQAYFDRIGWRPGIIAQVKDGDDDAMAEKARGYWSDAESAAFRVAFAGWREWPESASLVWESADPRDDCATIPRPPQAATPSGTLRKLGFGAAVKDTP